MKKEKIPTCPGCGRHCPLSHPRCKYGRDYLEKLQKKEAETPEKKKRFKWEGLVEKDGLLWQLLLTGCSIKKALRKKRTTEAALLQQLSDQEQMQLSEILKKLDTK